MKPFFLCILSIFCFLHCFSQSNPLERRVNLKLNKQPIEKILMTISRNSGVGFSYNSDQLPVDSLVKIDVTQKPISKVLDLLLADKYQYKTAGEHIIIMKKKEQASKAANEKQWINVKGRVYEWGSDKGLPNASVCNIYGKESALTDGFGHFNMKLKPKGRYVRIAINKQNYHDTIVLLKNKDQQDLEIHLEQRIAEINSIQPQPSSINAPLTIDQNKWVNRLVNKKMIIHANNLNFFAQTGAQISLLPFAGTNYTKSGSIINKLSVNILAGYAYGVSGIEFGGALNINRSDVKGIQFAGVGNITGKNLTGASMAGCFNHCLGNVRGIQIAGVYNTLQDSIFGVQLAGFANILNGKIKGAQLAGVLNITTREVNAAQIAGFANLALKNNKGMQMACVGNLARGDHKGVQFAGAINMVQGKLDGVQCSGMVNICKQDVDGVQIAGFVNRAAKVKGSQIGWINIADTVSGVTLGFLSFVKKGMRQLAVHTDEMGSVNCSYQTGSFHFYNIIGINAILNQSLPAWGMTYGFGTRINPEKKINIDLKFTNTNLIVGHKLDQGITEKAMVAAEINFKAGKHLSLFFGPSFNLFTYPQSSNELNDFPNKSLFTASPIRTIEGQSFKYWLGASLGLAYRI